MNHRVLVAFVNVSTYNPATSGISFAGVISPLNIFSSKYLLVGDTFLLRYFSMRRLEIGAAQSPPHPAFSTKTATAILGLFLISTNFAFPLFPDFYSKKPF